MASNRLSRLRSVPVAIGGFGAGGGGGGCPPAAAAAPAKSSPTPLPLADKKSERAAVQILAPSDGAVLSAGKVWVIGRSALEGKRVDILVDGSSVGKDTIDRGGFSLVVTLPAGQSTIVARAAGQEATVKVTVGGKPNFVFHPAIEKCSSCHPLTDKSFRTAGLKEKVCYRCHQRKDRRKFVHGPMGAGECTACHDPHGSSHKALNVAEPQALCSLCHDQKSSEQHLRSSKGKPCIQCHDPHASDKPFHQK
jgi:predicted CXXCH cytochrome family protein